MKKLLTSIFILAFTLTLSFSLVGCAKQYTYTFVDEDGTVLSEGTGKKGSTIVAPANPTKASTDEFSYEFIGWDKEVGKLESDITFIAQYKEVKRKYTVKFSNHDESVLKEESVEYGSLPTAPATPTKADTDEFSYEFVGWDKEVVAVTGDVTYTAKFEQTKRKYTYKFINFDDKPFNSTYTREFKENVVKEYLDGKGSIESLQIKYKILSHSTLKNMIVRIIIFGVQSNQKCII